MNRSEENKYQNRIFVKCGIYPTNKQILHDRLPQNLTQVDSNIISEAFLDQFETKRAEYIGTSNAKKRRKLQVPARKSITD